MCRKIVRTREFRVKKVVNNNRQLYDGLLTYYIKSSFLKLSQFTNCTFLDIEWTRPGSRGQVLRIRDPRPVKRPKEYEPKYL